MELQCCFQREGMYVYATVWLKRIRGTFIWILRSTIGYFWNKVDLYWMASTIYTHIVQRSYVFFIVDAIAAYACMCQFYSIYYVKLLIFCAANCAYELVVFEFSFSILLQNRHIRKKCVREKDDVKMNKLISNYWHTHTHSRIYIQNFNSQQEKNTQSRIGFGRMMS